MPMSEAAKDRAKMKRHALKMIEERRSTAQAQAGAALVANDVEALEAARAELMQIEADEKALTARKGAWEQEADGKWSRAVETEYYTIQADVTTGELWVTGAAGLRLNGHAEEGVVVTLASGSVEGAKSRLNHMIAGMRAIIRSETSE